MKFKLLTLWLVIVLILSACGGGNTFQQNLMKWERQPTLHYRFSVTLGCFCPFAGAIVTYEVKDGQVVDANISPPEGQSQERDQILLMYEPYNTMEKIFIYLEDAIQNADEVSVEYDATHGFPTSVEIDWIEMAVDDEMYLTISNFEALP